MVLARVDIARSIDAHLRERGYAGRRCDYSEAGGKFRPSLCASSFVLSKSCFAQIMALVRSVLGVRNLRSREGGLDGR